MKKNILLSAGVALTGLLAYAYTEVTETMTVELRDGSSVVYEVESVEKVSFKIEEATISLNVTEPGGEKNFRSETLETLFRYLPEDNDQQVQLFFGTETAATDFASLANGSYFFRLNCALSSLYQGEVSLTDGAVTLLGYECVDGEIVNTLENVSEGTLSTLRNSKGVLTLELDAKFADGTAVRASYQGSPVDITSVEELFPSGRIVNKFEYYNQDGVLSASYAIEGASVTTITSEWSRYKGLDCFKLDFGDPDLPSCEIYIDPSLMGQELDLSSTENINVAIKYNNVQVAGSSDIGMKAKIGKIQVFNNGDGTCLILADVTNKYDSWGIEGGTPERVVVSYNGPCEGLAPVVPNEFHYYNSDGEDFANSVIDGVTMKTITSEWSRYKGMNCYTMSFENSNITNKCEIYIDPELLGQELDLSSSENIKVALNYNTVQVAGSSDIGMKAKIGKIQVIDNGDGTCEIHADVTNKYESWGMEGGTTERVTVDYAGDLTVTE